MPANETKQSSTPPLDKQERKEVEQRSAIGANVVHGAVKKEGEDELKRPSSALAWSGLAAGLSMGFSMVAEALLLHALPDEPWRPLVSKLGYSVGFLIVVLGRQQLFTENTLTPILPLMERRDKATLGNVLRLWAVVFAANAVGAFIFAFVLANTNVFGPEMRGTFSEIGKAAMMAGEGFWTIVLRGIFAGWLIALMVWLLPFAETGRVMVIIIITYLVGLGGFAHVIAGSTETLYLVLIGQANWGDYLLGFMVPTLLGNILSGVSLVAALNHAQVVSGGGEDV